MPQRKKRRYRTQVPVPPTVPISMPRELDQGAALRALAELLRFVADRLIDLSRRRP